MVSSDKVLRLLQLPKCRQMKLDFFQISCTNYSGDIILEVTR